MSAPCAPSAHLWLLLWRRAGPFNFSAELLPAPRGPRTQGRALVLSTAGSCSLRALLGPSGSTHTQVIFFPLHRDAYSDHLWSIERLLSLNREQTRFRLCRG